MRREDLVLHGRLGLLSRAYHFDVYVCSECGYSEFYFKSKSIWV